MKNITMDKCNIATLETQYTMKTKTIGKCNNRNITIAVEVFEY